MESLMKQRIKQTIAALSLSLLQPECAGCYRGMDYTVLSHPIPQQQAGKIEVLEFSATSAFIVTISIRFCCNTAKPSLKMFLTDRARRLDAWNVGFGQGGRSRQSFRFEISNQSSHLQSSLRTKINLANTNVFRSWVGKQTGFDSKKLLQAYNSPAAALAAAKCSNWRKLIELKTHQLSSSVVNTKSISTVPTGKPVWKP